MTCRNFSGWFSTRATLIALSLCAFDAPAPAQTIDTIGAWTVGYVETWGYLAPGSTYGQVITAPGGALTDFTFLLNHYYGPAAQYTAHVYAWDSVNARVMGPALFSSGVLTASTNTGVFEPYTIHTNGTILTAGQQYVLFFTTLQIPQPPTQYRWGAVLDGYSGGTFYLTFSGDLTSTWQDLGTTDLAFTANFGSPAFAGEYYTDGLALLAGGAEQFTSFIMGGKAAFSTSTAQPLGYAAEPQSPANIWKDNADEPRFALFAGVFGGSADVESDGISSAWSSATAGFAAGGEVELQDWDAVIGFGVGFSTSAGSVNTLGQAVENEAWHAGVYARLGATAYEPGWGGKAGLSYANAEYTATRAGAIAEYDGEAFSGEANAYYGFALGMENPIILAPTLGMRGTAASNDGFAETLGGVPTGVTSDGADFEHAIASAGVRVSTINTFGSVTVVPEFSVAYERVLGDQAPTADLAIGPTTFVSSGPEESRDRINLGASVTMYLSDAVLFTAEGTGVFSDDRNELNGQGRLKVIF